MAEKIVQWQEKVGEDSFDDLIPELSKNIMGAGKLGTTTGATSTTDRQPDHIFEENSNTVKNATNATNTTNAINEYGGTFAKLETDINGILKYGDIIIPQYLPIITSNIYVNASTGYIINMDTYGFTLVPGQILRFYTNIEGNNIIDVRINASGGQVGSLYMRNDQESGAPDYEIRIGGRYFKIDPDFTANTLTITPLYTTAIIFDVSPLSLTNFSGTKSNFTIHKLMQVIE